MYNVPEIIKAIKVLEEYKQECEVQLANALFCPDSEKVQKHWKAKFEKVDEIVADLSRKYNKYNILRREK